ncbi:hypothetical protein [Parachitinimonas caeni]|uniref:Lipoprotein n=1 Tax=Parachitinimonas caeni TaxID=3031301 RepID=A0ABT7DTK6_9NEIS|nr:hypothetical protein [Parachitinimonas caeni]MDK2123356.1 hypothetical protein [Parachitinimonas caeni]
MTQIAQYKYFALMLTSFALVGCATTGKPDPLDREGVMQNPKQPVYLLSMTLRNNVKPKPPRVLEVEIEKENATQDDIDHLIFKTDKRGVVRGKVENTYYFRMEGEKGKYHVKSIRGEANYYPMICRFEVPLFMDIPSDKPGVYYLGHVDATVREAKGDEFRAGPLLPILDQMVCGFPDGTFEVKITDELASDKAKFLQMYPSLQNADIQTTLLPPHDRSRAQRWWAPAVR